jgi:hypothetical protein
LVRAYELRHQAAAKDDDAAASMAPAKSAARIASLRLVMMSSRTIN